MADRQVRPGLWTSPRFNSVTSAEAQLLFVKLITIVDDFGCFDGRAEVIAARAFPVGGLQGEELQAFDEMMRDLHRADLIVRYLNAGRPYFAIPRWSHDFRFKRDHPAPPINVDRRDLRLRGKYGKKIDWRNPEGTDDVSILLDLDGQPLARQPPEWRRVGSDWGPIAVTAPAPIVTVTAPVTAPVTASSPQPVTAQSLPQSQAYSFTALRPDNSTTLPQTTKRLTSEPVTARPQSLPTTAPTNGEIRLTAEGQWEGLTEAQRLRWQGMFDSLSIPDQLDRAAQWMLAHGERRAEAESVEGGMQQFLISWLLREARTHGEYKGKP